MRTRFKFTRKGQAVEQILAAQDIYLKLADRMTTSAGKRSVTVPRMLGIDEDMRHWSYFMLLDHNLIVNKSITARIRQLVLGEECRALERFDIKRDVMPSDQADRCVVRSFQCSIVDHIRTVESMETLRGTARTEHPLFGAFDAHMWHCMFAFHLQIHVKQAERIAESVRIFM
ncbi:hypothetical protein [Rubritalea tangerina]|uniref:hypothetical protein n=1 Tax=Rubritalea tangerina TaxID=430798 RepID=UPI0036174475